MKDIEYILGRPVLWTQREGQTALTDASLAYWRGRLAELRATRKPPEGYVVRLAILGSPQEGAAYEPFAPDGWSQDSAYLTSLNGIGLLIIQGIHTTPANAIQFVEATRNDLRATSVWPPLQRTVTVGPTTVPLDHSYLWRDEHSFHPESGLGGGWRIRVPRGT
ncbi:hypothetical protein EXE59_16610 [Nocardioides eburneiflavus]|uniref:Uncharacterized protein n=1 Tax=Nocardioides eburneiflavus TaxID=2518372 RepID=A0A4Z1CG83_9ACTN|nr:hypothetical protein [Nocardioides eburneiflavus]TGN65395.1 hypothetical protein EXE59_16610 [Nocardioides eburneiflavus]